MRELKYFFRFHVSFSPFPIQRIMCNKIPRLKTPTHDLAEKNFDELFPRVFSIKRVSNIIYKSSDL